MSERQIKMEDFLSLYDAAVAMCNAASNLLKGMGGDTSADAVRDFLRKVERGEEATVSSRHTFKGGDAEGKTISATARLVWEAPPTKDQIDKALKRADDKCLIRAVNDAERRLLHHLYQGTFRTGVSRQTFELVKHSPWRWHKLMGGVKQEVEKFHQDLAENYQTPWETWRILYEFFRFREREDLTWFVNELEKFCKSPS